MGGGIFFLLPALSGVSPPAKVTAGSQALAKPAGRPCGGATHPRCLTFPLTFPLKWRLVTLPGSKLLCNSRQTLISFGYFFFFPPQLKRCSFTSLRQTRQLTFLVVFFSLPACRLSAGSESCGREVRVTPTQIAQTLLQL